MIPLRLQLRNFMSYRESTTPLLFEGFRVACLSGDNGHGKSALLDAITWALWGKARAKSEDELIHHGRAEMEVEFEFDLGETRYRALRKRTLRRAGGSTRGVTTLDFQLSGDGGYRSIAGNSVQETQRKINEVLRMDYETFVNSAFVLQGKADSFTLKPPSERKKVLADLLGLGAYDALEELARERSREVETKRREEMARVRGLESEAAKRPEYEAEALKVAAELEDLLRHIEQRETRRTELREDKVSLERDASVLKEVRSQLDGARRELEESERQIQVRLARIAECERALSRREQVEAGHARLVSLREDDERMNERLRGLLQLQERRGVLLRVIDEARGRLQADLKVLASEMAGLERRRLGSDGWRRDLVEATARLSELERLGARQEERKTSISAWQHEMLALKTANDRIVQEGTRIKEKIDLLAEEGGRCPLCATELSADDRRRLAEELRAERAAKLEEYNRNQSRAKELMAEVERAKRALAAGEATLRDRPALERQAAHLEKSLAEADEAAYQIEQLRGRKDELEERLERRDYAPAEQEELAALNRRVEELGYDRAEHDRLKAELERCAPYEQLRQTLEVAARTLEQELPLREGAERLRDRWREQLAQLEARQTGLRARLERLPKVAEELAAVDREIEQLVGRQGEARLRQGRVQQMLNHCRYLEQQCAELSKLVARLAEEKSVYDDLVVAFGKKGIQAMIIETAVPELEDEANALLTRMTDGRMHVKFETQRAAKTTDSVIETLDIRIADELGTRGYELFSGGEAFKVNFAIRIALSKLLTRRAGARLEMLVVDEGFGTQDAQGRERLVEAINEVSGDFAKIVVITHIEDLKDAFPVRIDVTKTAEGSRISVM